MLGDTFECINYVIRSREGGYPYLSSENPIWHPQKPYLTNGKVGKYVNTHIFFILNDENYEVYIIIDENMKQFSFWYQ